MLKSLAIVSSQNVVLGKGAERVKKNKTTIVAMIVVNLFHSIVSLTKGFAFAKPFEITFVAKIIPAKTVNYLSNPNIFSGLHGRLRILTPVAL